MNDGGRYQAVLEGAAMWGSYYRANPEKFASDYLHLRLRRFQKILLVMMFWSTTFVYIASRGQGKSWLAAVYCTIRAILWPGSQIVITSKVRGQAINTLQYITQKLVQQSPELEAEIKSVQINGTNAYIEFKNTSFVKVVTAGDSARGNRANVLLVDEARLMDKHTIDTVLRDFLTLQREPNYSALSIEERAAELAKEKNLLLYLTSAYLKDNWVYTKCEDTFKAMLNPNRRQFVCGLPYQLSIAEGLLNHEHIQDQMAESNFSEIKFSMEMEALFYGSSDDAFFDYETISKTQKIKYAMLPNNISAKVSSPLVRIQPKQNGERRILSADIALMSSKKHNNDATAIFVNQMMPTKAGRYVSNIVYADSYEGLRTDDQALIIRKMFDEYMCDYLVLDTNGKPLPLYVVTYTVERGRNRERCNANPSGRRRVTTSPHATHRR